MFPGVTVAGRPRRPLWKRPYTSYRLGDKSRPDAGDEPQRLTLFVSGHVLDLAESLANRSGGKSVQAYCESLLIRSIQAERSRHQVEDAEARHGRLDGYRAIEDDPEFLAELSASVAHRDAPPRATGDGPGALAFEGQTMALPAPLASGVAETTIRHAGLGLDDPLGFLPSLRRGEAPGDDSIGELGAALIALDGELAGARTIDRRLAFALHRLAIESQVLHTDAWPGAFDAQTLDTIRAVQAAVERLLSGSANEAG